MIPNPVVFWSSGEVQCLVVHHGDACSYEVQIVDSGRLITRRWFARAEDATQFVERQSVSFASLVPKDSHPD